MSFFANENNLRVASAREFPLKCILNTNVFSQLAPAIFYISETARLLIFSDCVKSFCSLSCIMNILYGRQLSNYAQWFYIRTDIQLIKHCMIFELMFHEFAHSAKRNMFTRCLHNSILLIYHLVNFAWFTAWLLKFLAGSACVGCPSTYIYIYTYDSYTTPLPPAIPLKIEKKNPVQPTS